MDAENLLLELQRGYADSLTAGIRGLTERIEHVSHHNVPLSGWVDIARRLRPQPAERAPRHLPQRPWSAVRG